MKRTSSAQWTGTGKEGKGVLKAASSVINNASYTYLSRFENGEGTNPEELIAAAHAGCYSMKLAFILNSKGFTADEINTDCTISLENGKITTSALSVRGKVPSISKDEFLACAEEAKKSCPVSLALNLEITLKAELL